MMYVIRGGPVHRHANTLGRGKLPRPVFICCGSVGVVMTITGGIVLGVGQKKPKKNPDDYTYVWLLIIAVELLTSCIPVHT